MNPRLKPHSRFFAICGEVHLAKCRIGSSYKSAVIAAHSTHQLELAAVLIFFQGDIHMFAKFCIRAGSSVLVSFLNLVPTLVNAESPLMSTRAEYLPLQANEP
jgi:hypothetical protein